MCSFCYIYFMDTRLNFKISNFLLTLDSLDSATIEEIASKYISNNILNSRGSDRSNRYLISLESSYEDRDLNVYITDEDVYCDKFYNYEFFIELNYILHILYCVSQDYKKIYDYDVDLELDDILHILYTLYCVIELCNIRINCLISKLEYRIATCKSKKRLSLYDKLLNLKENLIYLNIKNSFKLGRDYISEINYTINFIEDIVERDFLGREKIYKENCKKKYKENISNKFTKRKNRENEYLELLNSIEYRKKEISRRDIARVLGVKPSAVTQFCKRHNIK